MAYSGNGRDDRDYSNSVSKVLHADQKHGWAVEDFGEKSPEAGVYGLLADAERQRHNEQYPS